MINRRSHKLFFGLLLVLVLYGLIATWWLRTNGKQILQEQLQVQLNMALELDELKFNPFTFKLHLTEPELTDQNQQTWLTADAVAVDFDPLHLLWGHWRFDDLTLIKPAIQLTTDSSGQVVVPAIPNLTRATDSRQLDWSINDIHIDSGKMNLQADNINRDFALGIKHISFKQSNLSSLDADQPLEVTITTDRDENLTFAGTLNLTQGKLAGQVNLTDWQAQTVDALLPIDSAWQVTAGTLQIDGQFDWDFQDKPHIEIQQAIINNWTMNEAEVWSVHDLNAVISNTVIDIQNLSMQTANLSSDQGQWFIYSQPQTAAIEQTNPPDPHPAPGMYFSIAHVQIQEWQLNWLDPNLSSPLQMNIPHVELAHFDNRSQTSEFKAAATYLNGDQLLVNGELRAVPLQIHAQLQAANWSLADWSPMIKQTLGVEVTRGNLNTIQHLTYAEDSLTLAGQVSVQQLQLKNDDGIELAAIKDIHLGSTHLDSSQKTIYIDQIELSQASGSVPENDEKLNFQTTTTKVVTDPSATPPWQIVLGQKR